MESIGDWIVGEADLSGSHAMTAVSSSCWGFMPKGGTSFPLREPLWFARNKASSWILVLRVSTKEDQSHQWNLSSVLQRWEVYAPPGQLNGNVVQECILSHSEILNIGSGGKHRGARHRPLLSCQILRGLKMPGIFLCSLSNLKCSVLIIVLLLLTLNYSLMLQEIALRKLNFIYRVI